MTDIEIRFPDISKVHNLIISEPVNIGRMFKNLVLYYQHYCKSDVELIVVIKRKEYK